MKSKKNSQKTLIYSIHNPQKPFISYIIGTIHLADEGAFKYVDIFKEKILTCDTFASEFDFREIDREKIVEAMYLPEGTTLNQLINKRLYKKLDTLFFRHIGLPLVMFSNHIPFSIYSMLSEAQFKNDRQQNLDETLAAFALENGKILRGVETFEHQLQTLQKMPIAEQLKSLCDIVKNFPKFKKQNKRMLNLYTTADVQKIAKSARKMTKTTRKTLLNKRNYLMAKRIAEMSDIGSVSAAIGAAHLGGKNGVLNILRQNGFVVKPVV